MDIFIYNAFVFGFSKERVMVKILKVILLRVWAFLLTLITVCNYCNTSTSWSARLCLTLSLLEYLKTRIRWGGGAICPPPPSKSHVLCPNMTNDTSLESSCAVLSESANKFLQIYKNWSFFAKSSYKVKMFAKKKLSKKWKIIHQCRNKQ